MTAMFKSPQSLIAIALILFVITCYYWMDLSHALNMPIWDDYGAILAFLNRCHDSNSFFSQLKLAFGKYAEHRVLYARLVSLLDYYVFGEVNFIRLNLIGNLGLIGVAVVLFKTIKDQENKWLIFLPVVLLLFQFQYWSIVMSPLSSLQNINTVFFAALSPGSPPRAKPHRFGLDSIRRLG